MFVEIGHASGDERGRATGGQLGDNTGKEVCKRLWYDKGWNKVIRPKSKEVAEKIAVAMEQACENDKIGYDQGNRLSLYKLAKKVNFDLSKITEACECDCSSLVAVCANAAGVKVNCGIYTGNQAGAFELTGQFDILTDSKYLRSSNYLKRGDILLKEFSHTAVVLSNSNVKDENKAIRIETAKGFDSSIAGTYETTTALNMRVGAGVDKERIGVAQVGEKVRCYGYYNVDKNGTKWYYVVHNGIACYCSSKYLEKK